MKVVEEDGDGDPSYNGLGCYFEFWVGVSWPNLAGDEFKNLL